MPIADCPAYVLAGGRSTRLGQDKARAELVEGLTLLEAVVDSIDGGFSSWTVVADREDKFDDLGLRTIADHRPHQGPLGGILRAAGDAESGPFFITSCDRVGLQRRWVHRLWTQWNDRSNAISFVVQGRREPLFAWYRAELADELRAFLDCGQRSVSRFLDAIDAQAVDGPDDWNQTRGVNTPDELREARVLFRKNQSSI